MRAPFTERVTGRSLGEWKGMEWKRKGMEFQGLPHPSIVTLGDAS